MPTCVLTCVHEYILHLWYSQVTAWMRSFQVLALHRRHLQHMDTHHRECLVGTAAHPQCCRGGGGLSACGPQAQTTSPTRHCPVPCRVPRRDMPQHPTGGAVLSGTGEGWGGSPHRPQCSCLSLASSSVTKLQAGFLVSSTSVGRREEG